jgi:hypothetical protein
MSIRYDHGDLFFFAKKENWIPAFAGMTQWA